MSAGVRLRDQLVGANTVSSFCVEPDLRRRDTVSSRLRRRTDLCCWCPPSIVGCETKYCPEMSTVLEPHPPQQTLNNNDRVVSTYMSNMSGSSILKCRRYDRLPSHQARVLTFYPHNHLLINHRFQLVVHQPRGLVYHPHFLTRKDILSVLSSGVSSTAIVVGRCRRLMKVEDPPNYRKLNGCRSFQSAAQIN